MKTDEWEERYRNDGYDFREYPSPILESCVDWLPEGRALDLAAGAGRNALFLAENDYDVDAIDVAEAALERGAAAATDRGVDGRIEWVQADLTEYEFPEGAYDVVNCSFYLGLERLPDVKEALAPGGVLVYEHHLRTADDVDRGPSTDRYRLRSNDLLRACLDLTVLRYEESVRERDGRSAAVVWLVARNSTGGRQSYPPASV